MILKVGYKRNSGWIIALIMFGLLVWQRACDNGPAPAGTKTKIVIKVDTVYGPAPAPVILRVPVFQPQKRKKNIPVKIDTAAIIQAYYTAKVYDRTIINDSNLHATLIDTVENNTLRSGIVTYQLKKGPVYIYNTTTITQTEKPTRKLFIGPHVNSQPGAGVDALYLNRKNQMYGGSIDAINGVFTLRTAWLISFKKN